MFILLKSSISKQSLVFVASGGMVTNWYSYGGITRGHNGTQQKSNDGQTCIQALFMNTSDFPQMQFTYFQVAEAMKDN